MGAQTKQILIVIMVLLLLSLFQYLLCLVAFLFRLVVVYCCLLCFYFSLPFFLSFFFFAQTYRFANFNCLLFLPFSQPTRRRVLGSDKLRQGLSDTWARESFSELSITQKAAAASK